jgi:hypothetical protein
MVGDPSLCEAVKLVELHLGIVFRIVAHINPVKYELLDLVVRKVRVQFMDALNAAFSRAFCCSRFGSKFRSWKRHGSGRRKVAA